MTEQEKKLAQTVGKKTAEIIEQGLLRSFEEPFNIESLNKEMIIAFFDVFLLRE